MPRSQDRFLLTLPRLVWSSLCLTLILFALPHSTQAAPEYVPVPAEDFKPRQGLGNVLQKLKAGQPVKIAYLGGSITAAPGWRIQTLKWFQEEFPQAELSEIHAAIGGTGSDLGVFRVERDALRHKPDLLFVEFAVNDGGAAPERIWQAMEGIVRQTWAANPQTDICFVYTFRTGYEKDLAAGNCPRAAGAMELLADHYGIPSINFAKRVVEKEQAGQLIYQSAEPTPAGVIRFSSDGVHPLTEGHEIYSEMVAEAIRQWKDSEPRDHQEKLATPFVESHWQAAKMVPLSEKLTRGDWQKLPEDTQLAKSFGNRLGTIWETTKPGSQITFRFRGSMAKLYDLVGPDGGQVMITVDGQTREKLVPRFDSYCTYHRLSTLALAEGLGPNVVHTITVEVHPEQPDRTPVAFRLKNPAEELKAEKFQGTKLRVGQILLIGDLVEE